MALIGHKTKVVKVAWIEGVQHKESLKRIQNYLKERVKRWEKDNKGKWFRARDLLGDDKKDWNFIPLQILFDHYKDKGEEYAYKQAAIDLGKILKKVLGKSKITYETHLDSNQVRKYIRYSD